MSDQNIVRQAAGTSTGGQFARTSHAESGLELGDEYARIRAAAEKELRNLARGRVRIPISELPERLNLTIAKSAVIGTGSYSYAGETVTLTSDQVVVVRQKSVKLTQVLGYLDGEHSPVMVTDRATGELNHLDGLHRLVAARMLNRPVQAQIWR